MEIFLLIVLFGTVTAQSTIPCTTPDGSEGKCEEYNNCPDIKQLINKSSKTRDEYVFLIKSTCASSSSSSQRLYCCPLPCYTPDGILGKYVKYTECPEIDNEFKKGDYNFIHNSLKETGGEMVCCGLKPRPAVTRGSCASKITAFPPHHDSQCCGIQVGGQNRIVGGNKTALDEYPWLALLKYKRPMRICGGALISNRYVLTAAHCVKRDHPPISVTLGEYDVSTDEDCIYSKNGVKLECSFDPVTLKITKMISHPDYNPSDRTLKNDISLIRLENTVAYTDFIRPICLPTVHPDIVTSLSLMEGTKLFVAGWGFSDTSSGQTSDVKYKVDLPYVPLEDCAKVMELNLWTNQICAGGEKNKDSCDGDSGGPLMYKSPIGQQHIVGIVSFGTKECGVGKPGVYTKVSEYNAWIYRNIEP